MARIQSLTAEEKHTDESMITNDWSMKKNVFLWTLMMGRKDIQHTSDDNDVIGFIPKKTVSNVRTLHIYEEASPQSYLPKTGKKENLRTRNKWKKEKQITTNESSPNQITFVWKISGKVWMQANEFLWNKFCVDHITNGIIWHSRQQHQIERKRKMCARDERALNKIL